MRSRNVYEAPEPTGVCCVDGCYKPAEETWFPDHCAVREAGIEPTWKHLCLDHDLELNKYVTRMFFGNKYDYLLNAYTDKQRARSEAVAEITKLAKELGIEVVAL